MLVGLFGETNERMIYAVKEFWSKCGMLGVKYKVCRLSKSLSIFYAFLSQELPLQGPDL